MRCHKEEVEWRCTDCLPRNKLCTTCCRTSHMDNPFHELFQWAGGYWVRSSKKPLKLVIPVGYRAGGIPCFECPRGGHIEPTVLTAVDHSGVHELAAGFCHCEDRLPEDEQLLYAGLYPATYTNISTVFTLKGLERFRYLNLECKTAATGFYSFLRRITNPRNPILISVRPRGGAFWKSLTAFQSRQNDLAQFGGQKVRTTRYQ